MRPWLNVNGIQKKIFDQIRSIKNQDKNESKKEVEIDSGMSLFNL